MIARLGAGSFSDVVETVWRQCGDKIPHFAPFNCQHFCDVFYNLLKGDIGVFFGGFSGVKPVGFLAGLHIADMMTGMKQAVEYLWVVIPEYRKTGIGIRLFKRFEEDAKANHCKMVVCGSSALVNPKAMAKMYGRQGYVPHAYAFKKEI